MANEIWYLPYTAQQLENAATNQVPRINGTNNHWEVWDIASGKWVDTGVIAQGSIPIYGTVTLTINWTDNDPLWSQAVSIPGAGADSIIDIRPTAAQLAQLADDGVSALTLENNGGAVTVFAIGAAPSVQMDVDYTMTSNTVVPLAISDNAAPSYNTSGEIYTNEITPLFESVEE